MADKVLDGKRYSPFDRDEVHADMRVDAATTRRNMASQPAVVEAHRECATCAELVPVARETSSRRGHIRLLPGELADALGLPGQYRIARMFVDDDPHAVVLVIESPDLDEVDEGMPAPGLRF